MALAAVQTAMNLEGKNVHPFFTKPSNGHALEPLPTANGIPIDDTHHDAAYSDTDPKSANGQQKRARKTDAVKGRNAASHSKNQASLDRFTLPPAMQSTNETNVHDTNTPVEASLEVDPNLDRRKRQKTASPEPVFNMLNSAQPEPGAFNWYQQLQAEEEVMRSNGVQGTPRSAIDAPLNTLPKQADQPDQAVEPNTLPVADLDIAANSNDSAASEPMKTTPKKQIRITKSGRLVSSPPKPTFEASPKKKRGRPRKEAKIIPTVTVIRYGTDAASRSALGQKIEDILNAKKRLVARPATQKKAPSKPAGPTHPFFLGKASKEALPAKVVTELPPATPRKSACTPGKLRAEFRRDQSPEGPQAFSRGLQSNRVGKQSGLKEASWPTGENAHVRNLGSTPSRLQNATSMQLPLRPRKLKNAVVTLPEHENVVERLAQNLKSHSWSKARSHSEFEPPEDVRLPKRLLTTGAEIQRRVREQLLVRLSSSGIPQDARQKSHPAVRDLFQGIESTLTPFDEGRCESQPWTLKYCPKYASHVLQTGTEAVVLKDWLQSLTVMAVSGASKVATTIDGKQPPRKKRKKALDDFIVPDGEGDEEEDMVMLPVAEGAGLPSRSFRQPQWIRNNNVVLISGPHGCGKSAAVHAVAKELGFEVFEIHAGMRRSGKDIQDKVGDMTANHLVNHKRSAASVQENVQAADDANDNRVDTVLEDDISSGRQATMASFFQVKPGTGAAKPKVKAKVPEVHKAPAPSTQATLPMAQASHTSQKQSLILIEEADILFEEDQQFWAQITKIASLSKRPIVITCNDERQIPMQDLPIAAILRLQPAPVELATDYLLVVAGREGHILERQAVKELYESKDYDLRASIMELDFWCQMSVGDRKGGLEWMYQRWPPGKDTNEHGQTLRVASEGTYKSGMGWLSHNVLETQGNPVFDKEEELLQEVWADWGISPSAWGIPEASGTRSSREPSTEWFDQLGDLISLDNYADSLSAADMFCRVGLPTYDPSSNQPTDSTQPAITEKSRLSYTLAAPLLQVDHSSDFLNLDTAFSTQTHLAIQRTYPDLSHSHSLSSTPNLRTESDYARAILHHRKILNTKTTLTRPDFALALDPLADPPDQLLPERSSFIFIPSSFDRTFSIITLDLAPYVRSIVAHELILEEQRVRMSSVLNTAGGIGGKRGRTTRASRVALEGGIRETKRKEKWFDADVDFDAVMRTAGREWTGMGWRCDGWNEEGSASYMGTRDGTASLAGTQDGDVIMEGSQE